MAHAGKDAKMMQSRLPRSALVPCWASGLKVTPREKSCVVLTGGNWDLCDLAEVYQRGE